MKYLLAAAVVLAGVAPALAQTKGKDYAALVEVGADEDGRIATTVRAAEVKEKRGYSPGAESMTVFWVEARKPDGGPARVSLVGQRLRYITPSEAPQTKKYGPWDPVDPASVGSPWKDADLRYRGSEVECISDAYWCWQTWFIEVVLPESVVRTVVNDPKKKEIPLSLSKRRKVEWRTPRAEVIAALEALGVVGEFSTAQAQ